MSKIDEFSIYAYPIYLMHASFSGYRAVDFMVGVGVCLVVGYTVGVYFDLTARQAVFPLALFLGLYFLFLVGTFGNFTPARNFVVSLDMSQARERKTAQVSGSLAPVAEVGGDQRVLSVQQAQQWLDELLVRQQRGGTL